MRPTLEHELCNTYFTNCLEHTISPRDIVCSMLDVVVLHGDEELYVAGFGMVRCWTCSLQSHTIAIQLIVYICML